MNNIVCKNTNKFRNRKFVFLVLNTLHLPSNFKLNTMSFFKENFKFYNEKSILTATKIVAWKTKSNSYNFNKLPKTVILAPATNVLKGFRKFKYRKIKGLLGNNYLLNKDFLLSFNFGIGASAIVTHIEELRVFGVKNIIFIGFAGILSNKIKDGNSYLITKALAISGVPFYYFDKEQYIVNSELVNKYKMDLDLKEKTVVSIDIPYRETKTLVEKYIDKGASLIDMESAAIIAVSQFYNLDCMCVLVASDAIENGVWIPPKNNVNLTAIIDRTIKKITSI